MSFSKINDMDVATIKRYLENQIGDINKELKNIYLPHEAVLILLGKRTAFAMTLEFIDSLQQEQKPAEWSEEDEKMLENIRYALGYAFVNNVIDEQTTDYVTTWINSLRPSWRPSEEQPEVDLEKEIDDWYNTMGIPVTTDALKETARHFYELGRKDKEDK